MLEQMIIECHKSMIECIKSDNLDMAIKYQELIKEYKQLLNE